MDSEKTSYRLKKYNQYYQCLEFSDQERDAVKGYQGIDYSVFSSMLELGVDNEVQVEKKLPFLGYNMNVLKRIPEVYSAMYKYAIQNNPYGISRLHRGTTLEEVQRIEKTKEINKFLSTTTDKQMAEGYFSLNWDNPASISINASGFMPYVSMAAIDEEYGNNWEKEYLLSPFTKVSNILRYNKDGRLNKYSMTVEKRELIELSAEERLELFNQINNGIDEANFALQRAFQLDKEKENLYFQKERINIWQSRGGVDQEDRQAMNEDIERISTRLEEISIQRSDCVARINDWKSIVIDYCMAECREVEKNIEIEMQKEEEHIVQETENKKIQEAENKFNSQKVNAESVGKGIYNNILNMNNAMGKILENQLIFKRKAEEMGFDYTSWYDIQEAHAALENLGVLTNDLRTLTNGATKDNIDEISKFNINVDRTVQDIIREELRPANEIELNLFKKSISDKILEIKIAADTAWIDDEEAEIKSKGGIRKFFDRLIGQSKADELRLEQIGAQRKAMRDAAKSTRKIDLNKTYSVHEMLAEIDIFVYTNNQDPEMTDSVQSILRLRQGMTSMFGVDEAKVMEIMQETRNRNLLVVQNDKLTKEQKAELATRNWINQNGYDRVYAQDMREELAQPRDELSSKLNGLSTFIAQNMPEGEGKVVEEEVPVLNEELDKEDTLELFPE